MGYKPKSRYQACLILCLVQFLLRGIQLNGEVFEFAPYIVESTRLETSWLNVPQALSVIGQQPIQRANLQITLDESLQGIPGVFILNPYNYAQDTRIAIRGFGARADFGIRGIRLIIDGIPATTPDGQGEVDGMDLGSVARIEVLRGPSAAFYGAASGGVILMDTESGPETPFFETRLTTGDYGFLNLQFKAAGQEGRLNYLISGGQLDSDGYRRHSETENSKVNGKLRYQVSEGHQLQLIFNIIDFPLQNDPGGLTRQEAMQDPRQARARNVQYDGGESVVQERFGLSYQMELDAANSLEFLVFHTHRDFANRLPFVGGGQVDLDRVFYGSRIAYTHAGDKTRFSTGIDFDKQEDSRHNFDNLQGTRGSLALDQDEHVKSLGLFAVYEMELSKSFHFSSAIRYDDITFDVMDALLADGDDSGEITFSEFSPTVGIVWSLSDTSAIYANVARSFETPTTTEFDNPEGGGFNANLQSQKATNLEVGSRGYVFLGGINMEYNLALFQINIEDALVPFELSQFPGREFYRNAGESTRRGIELQVQTYMGNGFSLGLDYTWSDFAYDSFVSDDVDYSGKRIPGIPQHFAGISVSYGMSTGFFATWKSRWVGSFYANDGNQEKIRSYSTSEFKLGYVWQNENWTVEPYFLIDNIFNQSFFSNVRINAFGGRHFEPAPKRNYHGGIRIRYGF